MSNTVYTGILTANEAKSFLLKRDVVVIFLKRIVFGTVISNIGMDKMFVPACSDRKIMKTVSLL